MAEYTNGCEIDLGKVPLKQEGLSSWEILVSESQERMTVAFAPKDKSAFEALAELHEVEATQVATFTNTGYFHVKHGAETVAYLAIEFLHDGVPQLCAYFCHHQCSPIVLLLHQGQNIDI